MSWKTVKLGDVCELKNGFAFKSKLFRKSGIPILRISNIQNDKIDISKIIYCDPNDYEVELQRYEVHPNDLLIAMSGATTGKIGFNNTDKIFYLNQRVGNLRPSELLNKSYLYYLLSTLVEENLNISKGAAQPNLSSDQIRNIKFSLPPLEEQKRIVAKLDAVFGEIDKAIEIETKQLDNYEVLQDLILDSVYESYDENLIQLSDVCKFVRGPFGGSLKKEIFKESGFAVYEQQHAINNHSSKFRYFIDENKFNEMERFQVLSNDILMSCSGTIGKTTIVPDNAPKGIINQALLKITPSKKINSEFLQSYMQSSLFKKQLMQDVSGSAIQNVASVKILKTIKIPFIPLIDQINIVRILNDQKILFEENKKKNQKKLEELHQLRSSILTKELKSEAA